MTILVAIYHQFVSWCIPEAQVAWLREQFPRHTFVRADSDEETLARIPPAEIAFSSLLTAADVAAAPRLRWIHSPAAGVGGMLVPAVVYSDIVVSNSRGNSAITIAEHSIGVTLALFRHLPLAWERQRAHEWAQDEFNTRVVIRTLRGSRVLVVGLGAIGGETARLAAAMGAEVTGVRRRVEAGGPEGVRVVPPAALHEELPASDVVIIAAPQTRATTRLIGAPELALMKDGAVLVNVSRGKLVDEHALAAALETGRLRGAALDVFEHEPLALESPLWGRPDVLITPHVSGFHARYWPDAAALFADNLRRFEAGTPLLNVVDKHAGY